MCFFVTLETPNLIFLFRRKRKIQSFRRNDCVTFLKKVTCCFLEEATHKSSVGRFVWDLSSINLRARSYIRVFYFVKSLSALFIQNVLIFLATPYKWSISLIFYFLPHKNQYKLTESVLILRFVLFLSETLKYGPIFLCDFKTFGLGRR